MIRFDHVLRQKLSGVEVFQDGATLRVVETQSRWTPTFVAATDSTQVAPEIAVHAEVVAKRFGSHDVQTDRFTAHLTAQETSPAAILAALLEACAKTPDLQAADGDGDRVVLQISLTATRGTLR